MNANFSLSGNADFGEEFVALISMVISETEWLVDVVSSSLGYGR